MAEDRIFFQGTWVDSQGAIYSRDGKTLLRAPKSTEDGAYYIRDGCMWIDNEAFRYSEGYTYVYMPTSMIAYKLDEQELFFKGENCMPALFGKLVVPRESVHVYSVHFPTLDSDGRLAFYNTSEWGEYYRIEVVKEAFRYYFKSYGDNGVYYYFIGKEKVGEDWVWYYGLWQHFLPTKMDREILREATQECLTETGVLDLNLLSPVSDYRTLLGPYIRDRRLDSVLRISLLTTELVDDTDFDIRARFCPKREHQRFFREEYGVYMDNIEYNWAKSWRCPESECMDDFLMEESEKCEKLRVLGALQYIGENGARTLCVSMEVFKMNSILRENPQQEMLLRDIVKFRPARIYIYNMQETMSESVKMFGEIKAGEMLDILVDKLSLVIEGRRSIILQNVFLGKQKYRNDKYNVWIPREGELDMRIIYANSIYIDSGMPQDPSWEKGFLKKYIVHKEMDGRDLEVNCLSTASFSDVVRGLCK